MKNFTRLIVATMSMMGIIGIASAQGANSTPAASVLPADVDIVYEVKTSEQNPLEEWFTTSISDSFGNDMSSDDKAAMVEIIKNGLTDNTMTYAMKVTPVTEELPYPEWFMSFHMNSTDFAKLLELAKKEIGLTQETYEGKTIYYDQMTIYPGENDFYGTYLGDLFVLTNSKENLMKVIDNYTKKTATNLAGSPTYQQASNHYLEKSFFNVYFNPATLLSDENVYLSLYSSDPFSQALLGVSQMSSEFQKNVMSAILSEAFSLVQTESGFDFRVAVEGDKNKLTELNLPFDKYNFVPNLYTNISGKDLLFYEERNNLKLRFEDTLKMFSENKEILDSITQWKTEFQEKSDINFDQDVLPLLSQKSAIAVHKTDQIWPAVTIVFEINSSDNAKAANVLAKLNEYLKTESQNLESQTGYDFVTSGITNIGGIAFYEHNIEVTKLIGPSASELAALDADLTKIPLRMALANGLLVISTHPSLETVFRSGEGLTNNTAFNSAFTNRTESTESLIFMNIDVLRDYINMVMEAMKALPEVTEMIKGVLSPWHNLYIRTGADADTVWANAKVNVDIEGFANYPKLFEDLFTRGYEYEAPPVPDFPTESISFCDVHENDWFHSYVNSLSQDFIIQGYPDGCFHPEREVTRGEFIKMAMRSISNPAMTYEYSTVKKYFTDIPQNPSVETPNDPSIDIYLNINEAAGRGYITGYSDGSFHPDAPITRAEVVQVLYNMSTKLAGIKISGHDPLPFNDVNTTDWFMVSVMAAYHYNLVDGVTPKLFEPNRHITRAETAKIVKLFMNLENGLSYDSYDTIDPSYMTPSAMPLPIVEGY